MTQIERARASHAAGDDRRAARLAWSAANKAVRREDRESLQVARTLAASMEASTDGRAAKLAASLLAFCDACLRNPQGLGTPTEFARLMEREPRRH
jgi:hypothetical protein